MVFAWKKITRIFLDYFPAKNAKKKNCKVHKEKAKTSLAFFSHEYKKNTRIFFNNFLAKNAKKKNAKCTKKKHEFHSLFLATNTLIFFFSLFSIVLVLDSSNLVKLFQSPKLWKSYRGFGICSRISCSWPSGHPIPKTISTTYHYFLF